MTKDAIRFDCEWCGKAYRASAERAGQQTKCTGCGADITVPMESKKPDPLVDLVGFNCVLCNTRINAPSRHVGRKVKCPDCERVQRVPQPEPQAPAAARPAAMDGEQYELYEGENQPWGVDLARFLPQHVAFSCRVCGTVLQAEEDQVGQEVACHDCGARTVVPEPPTPQPKAKEVVGYALDADDQPPAAIHGSLFEDYAARPPAGYRTLGQRSRKSSELDGDNVEVSPEAPRWGLGMIVGVLDCWVAPGMWLAWLGLSALMLLTLPMLPFTFAMISGLGSLFGMLFGIAMFGAALICTMIWVGLTCAIFWAVFDDSSAGVEQIGNWPSIEAGEWIGPALRLVFAAVVSTIPGALLVQVYPDAATWHSLGAPGVVSAGSWLVLPWILMSQLDLGSPWGVFSPRLVRTLWHAPISWLLFYVETLLLDLGLYKATEAVSGYLGVFTVLVACPGAVLVMLLYARLLGRLTWVAGSMTPEAAASGDEAH